MDLLHTKFQGCLPEWVKFIFSVTQVFFIEVGNYYMRFYTNRAQVQATGVSAYDAGTAYVIGNFVTYLWYNLLLYSERYRSNSFNFTYLLDSSNRL